MKNIYQNPFVILNGDRKSFNHLCLNFCLILLSFFATNQLIAAPTISFEAPDRVAIGTNFEIDVNISGLDPADDLGAFSFDFFFTKDLANFLPINSSFGNQLGDPNDPFETIFGVSESIIGINLKKLEVFEVSFLFDLSSQLDDFTLFTIGLFTPRFSGEANKVLGITANNFVLSDAFGNDIETANTTVGKGIVVVSEPKPLLLVVFGLAVFGFLSRKNTFKTISSINT